MHLPALRALAVGIAMTALVVGNTGCRKIRQKMEEKAAEQAIKAGTGGAVTVNEGDKGAFTVQDNKGNQVTIGENKVPADWPSNVPLYPKATVAASFSSKDNGKNAHVLTLETPDKADDVFAFYKSKLGSFEKQSEMSSNQMRMLVVQDKRTKTSITVVVGVSGSNTTIQLTTSEG